ncbi:membrane protein [Luteitalea sp. TBR-22]|uniref:alpha/beta hydrolase n=1 Tax=Luteitalea sp. TBR-22 TaxID=2802971 RepID=UPI001AF68091|nr:alpha/beta fold hydrolase [Luteitalea sp. TBR-22]BCS34991.1 membrane protein [Luteitalea sp. TBR-22]
MPQPHLATRILVGASRFTGRWVVRALLLAAGLLLAVTAGFAAYAVLMLPDVEPWHTTRLRGEFTEFDAPGMDFAGYQAREARLFEEMAEAVAAMPRDAAYFAGSRYDPNGLGRRLAGGQPYNRTTRRTPAGPLKGAALLIHGLSDGPYSMQNLGDVLLAQGFEVTILRLPGHGTLPSAMVHMEYDDWVAAMTIAARDISSRLPKDLPFYLAGYSTGGSLAMTYALDRITPGADPSLRTPTRVLLFSAAIELTPAAALTPILDLFARLPVQAFEKVNWQSIGPEYDPYKFVSFPVNASRQVYKATRKLQRQLLEAEQAGRLGQLPSVVAFQSAVDSTTGANGVSTTVFGRLKGAQHRLVLFDVNRHAKYDIVRQPSPGTLVTSVVDGYANGTRQHTLLLVTNRSRETEEVEVREYAPGRRDPVVTTPGLSWPLHLVSVGHVSVPFPPKDPLYGYEEGSGANGIPSIGSWRVRGEEGAIVLPLGALGRIRANPFWLVLQQQVEMLAAADTTH